MAWELSPRLNKGPTPRRGSSEITQLRTAHPALSVCFQIGSSPPPMWGSDSGSNQCSGEPSSSRQPPQPPTPQARSLRSYSLGLTLPTAGLVILKVASQGEKALGVTRCPVCACPVWASVGWGRRRGHLAQLWPLVCRRARRGDGQVVTAVASGRQPRPGGHTHSPRLCEAALWG